MARGAAPPPGTFVRIPLEDGSFGYGRALTDPYMAFYDFRTDEPSSDLDEIASKPVLFRQAVRIGPAPWEYLGERELEGEVAEPVVRFTQNVANYRDCTIYDSTGMSRPATPEECVGLEQAAVWEAHHIAGRLLDTFEGRPNPIELHMRVQLGP